MKSTKMVCVILVVATTILSTPTQDPDVLRLKSSGPLPTAHNDWLHLEDIVNSSRKSTKISVYGLGVRRAPVGQSLDEFVLSVSDDMRAWTLATGFEASLHVCRHVEDGHLNGWITTIGGNMSSVAVNACPGGSSLTDYVIHTHPKAVMSVLNKADRSTMPLWAAAINPVVLTVPEMVSSGDYKNDYGYLITPTRVLFFQNNPRLQRVLSPE